MQRHVLETADVASTTPPAREARRVRRATA
jgi:hypothetical protein